jgi:uncharacterized protein YdaU (DUF1376 family)
MNHYPRHVGDWLKDTIHLSEVEECIYSRMIDLYYSREGPLPLDDGVCCRMVRATSKEARKAIPGLLREFFKEGVDGWHSKRCDEEIQAYHERSESAKRSVNVRWSKRNTNVDTNVILAVSRKPLTVNQDSKATTKPVAAAPLGVRQEVWDEWRKVKGKKLTPAAVRLQSKQLSEWAAAGDDPNAIIEQSIRNTWAGLFPLKRAGPQAVQDSRSATAAAMRGQPKENHEPTDITSESVRVA